MPLASSRTASEKRMEEVEREKKQEAKRQQLLQGGKQLPRHPSKQQHPPQRLSSSFPSTCASSTVVNAAKVRRRQSLKRQGSQSSLDSYSKEEVAATATTGTNAGAPEKKSTSSVKENEAPDNPVVQRSKQPVVPDSPTLRPTPYWQVAAERGMSPPETRSATKKKKKPTPSQASSETGIGNNNKGGVALFFSPPDQEANARREQAEQIAQDAERARRVNTARENGQLLVFSPSNRPLNLHSEDKADSDQPPEIGPEPEVEVADDDDDDCGAISMEVQVGNSPTVGTSLLSSSSSEEVAALVKQLLEQVQHNDGRQAKELLAELHNANHIKLEETNRELQQEVKNVTEQWRTEKEHFLVKVTRLELELETAQRQIEAVRQLEEKLAIAQRDSTEQQFQIQQLHDRLASSAKELQNNQAQLAAFREHGQTEIEQWRRSAAQLEQANLNLTQELQVVQAAREELNAKVDAYEQAIRQREEQLRSGLEQLERVQQQLHSKEDTLEAVHQASSGHEATILALKTELDELQQVIHDKDRCFSDLEEEMDEKLMDMASEVEVKNAQIGDLYRQLGDKEQELQSRAKEWMKAKDMYEGVEKTQAAQLADLNTALEEAMGQLDEFDTTKRELNEKLVQLEQLLSEEQERGHVQSSDLKATQDQLVSTQVELDNMKTERDTLESLLEQRSKDTVASSAQLRSFEESYQQMEIRLKTKEIEQAHQISVLEEANRTLQHQLKTSERERDEARSNMLGFNDREAELYRKLQESDRIRRDLHSRVMQLTGNIRVYVRVRPALPSESNEDDLSTQDSKKRNRDGGDSPFSFPGVYDREVKSSRSTGSDDATKNVIVATEPYKDRGGLSDRRKTWKFAFDNIFSPHHGQEDVWEATLPLVQSAADGYNVTIFAYGQTGSGKTYTMLGDERCPGLIGRAVQKLFASKHEIEELSKGETRVQISVELLEIYNERVRDLLDPEGESNRSEQSLKVTSKEVVGNVLVPTETESEVMELVALAQDRRCVKATSSNSESSRSHLLFTINFDVQSQDGSTRSGKLNICDLAGSERLGKSGAHHVGGALLEETKNINKSLSVLSNVIERLQAGDKTIPFRESKLTYLLQNSLSGNSKTLAIVCCSPLTTHFHESLCSLRFAEKVNKCELKAVNSFSC